MLGLSTDRVGFLGFRFQVVFWGSGFGFGSHFGVSGFVVEATAWTVGFRFTRVWASGR